MEHQYVRNLPQAARLPTPNKSIVKKIDNEFNEEAEQAVRDYFCPLKNGLKDTEVTPFRKEEVKDLQILILLVTVTRLRFSGTAFTLKLINSKKMK